MGDNVVVDFTYHLKQKQKKQEFKEHISASGWEITEDINSFDSDVCMYLIDSKESGVVLFGCSLSDFPEPKSSDVIHWGHFVLAWDVIADPDMPFDETHKNNTISFALRSVPGLVNWPNIKDKIISASEEKKAHVLVVINREDRENPLEIIVAKSESPVMTSASIKLIVQNFFIQQ